MDRERVKAAIAALQQHATSIDEMHLINYLKINLGNLWELVEDDFEPAAEVPSRMLEFLPKNLDNNEGGGGLEIKVPGFKGNPEDPDGP